ncbi:NfeD family protein [Sandaracinobacteroides sp. A072]|uniref:NfeD family protein n=1 Tax=Sandaracinobacteroides sp. A072 TaxID=3461146 RepID=UPI00404109C3
MPGDGVHDFFFSPWGWLSLAAIMAGLEILLPGAFMIWLAAAALATALVVLLLPLGWGAHLVLFAVFAAVAVFLSLRLKRRRPIATADPALNRRALRLSGEVVLVTQAIEAGHGRVKLGDTEWSARGPDMPAGSHARIIGMDGATLLVEPLAG